MNFHDGLQNICKCLVQVALPLSAATSKESTRVRLLCSLAASSTPKAVFEDVTDITPITISKGMIFDKNLVQGEANSFTGWVVPTGSFTFLKPSLVLKPSS